MERVDDLGKHGCTGCSACFNACPKAAIKMDFDQEGFCYPLIDEDLCINCQKCVHVCPVITKNLSDLQLDIPQGFAARNCDDDVRKKSSSGGIFTALANYFFECGGCVCGASYDETGRVFHKIIYDESELDKMRGAKYVQSNIGCVYKEIVAVLKQGKKVLFVGTPCQTAGLYNFVGKDDKNLLLVDMICHGVPSPKVFEHHLREITGGKKISNLQFRNKKLGWRKSRFVVVSENGCYERALADDPYICNYMQHLFTRPSCLNCDFAALPRRSDITIGDFWGIERVLPDFDDGKGSSALILNSKKGEEYFSQIRAKLVVKGTSYQNIANGNPNYLGKNCFHVNRSDFFADFNKRKEAALSDLINDNVTPDKNVAILNFHWENNNYGAVLTAYALNRTIRNLGYKAYNIDYVFTESKGYDNSFEIFRQKHLPMTQRVKNYQDLEKLNPYFRSFVVGSDQVWRRNSMIGCKPVFFLDFADNTKNIFSYAASFGEKSYGKNIEEKQDAVLSLMRFSNISVRESFGVDVVRDEFKMKAVEVLDPVFLLDKNEWQKLFEPQFPLPKSPYVTHYVLEEAYRRDLEGLKSKVINMREGLKIEEWLMQLNGSDFFITDSFHGVCFAIIFQKQFICVNSNPLVIGRIESILKKFKLTDRLVENINDDIFNEFYQKKINYNEVEKILCHEKARSMNFLISALQAESKGLENPVVDLVKELQGQVAKLEKRVNAQKYKSKYLLYKFLHLITFNNKKIKKKYKHYKSLYKAK